MYVSVLCLRSRELWFGDYRLYRESNETLKKFTTPQLNGIFGISRLNGREKFQLGNYSIVLDQGKTTNQTYQNYLVHLVLTNTKLGFPFTVFAMFARHITYLHRWNIIGNVNGCYSIFQNILSFLSTLNMSVKPNFSPKLLTQARKTGL